MAGSSVSVVIASRDRKSYVLDLLGDISRQSSPPAEVVVVDQSDEPYDLSGCVYVRSSERGPCRARNHGARVASGDILVFLDDDVRIAEDFISEITGSILYSGHVAVCGAICDARGNYKRSEPDAWRGGDTSSWIRALTNNPGHPGAGLALNLPAGCSAILRAAFLGIGGFDPFFDPNGACEDREIALRLFVNGISIYYNGKARVRHLAADMGGRRSPRHSEWHISRLTPFESNIPYVVGRYFGDPVFSAYCGGWLRSVLVRKLTPNPLSWARALLRYVNAVNRIKEIRNSLMVCDAVRPYVRPGAMDRARG